MMQQELFLPTWPNFTFPSSILDHKTCYAQEIDLYEGDFSVVSSNSYAPAMILDEFSDMEGLETISRRDIESICEWMNRDDVEASSPSHDLAMEGDEYSLFSSESNDYSSVIPKPDASLVFPGDAKKVDDQLMLIHLLKAYGEAMENGQMELAEVILNSIGDKSSPLGGTTERVVYNLFRSRDGQGEHLRVESSKNLAAAFMALYQSIPNGRFAHFTANSAILDSAPDDVGVIHVVDFDMGEGVQWPPLIEALSRSGRALKLTSIKFSDNCCWDFEATKKRLLSHAQYFGVSLEMEEQSVEDVCRELMWRKHGREWVAFNCMVGLPHMGRRRPRRRVKEFLTEAKALVAANGGILVLGDGREDSNSNNIGGYAEYFDGILRHYQALFESLEWNFPSFLAEGRAAMESLFLAPCMSPVALFRDWEEMGKTGGDIQTDSWLGGRKLSLGSLVEAKEMVVEGENWYTVKMEGVRENEMVLRWKDTPLVRVSTWM